MTLPRGFTIELVRGRRDERRDEELIAFWTGHGALSEAAARARLPHVVCLLRDPQGDVAAVNSVVDEPVPMLGGCRLWVYRTFAPGPEARAASEEMVRAAWEALAVGFDPDSDAPIGVCRFVTEAVVAESLREPIWPTSKLMFAGYSQAGEQLRVRYFEGAKVQ